MEDVAKAWMAGSDSRIKSGNGHDVADVMAESVIPSLREKYLDQSPNG